jgi:hypothetical protein
MGPREIKSLNDRKPGDIGEAMLAVGVCKDPQRQPAFLEALKFTATDHANKQYDPGLHCQAPRTSSRGRVHVSD